MASNVVNISESVSDGKWLKKSCIKFIFLKEMLIKLLHKI